MRSKIGMMSWERRLVVADGMINGLGYADIRAKLAATGVADEDLPSDDSMRTYRDSRELRSMLAERIQAQKDHRDAARAADRVESLIDLATVRALEGLYDDLGEPETTIGERIKAVRVLTMYRRQLFLERQAGDVKPNEGRHRVLESDLENPDHILFEPGSQAAWSEPAAQKSAGAAAGKLNTESTEDTEREGRFNTEGTEDTERGTEWGGRMDPASLKQSGMSGDESGYVGMSGDESGYVAMNGDVSGCMANRCDGVMTESDDAEDMEDGEDEELIGVDEVRAMTDADLAFLAQSPEFAGLLGELRHRSQDEQVRWVDARFPDESQVGMRLLWVRILVHDRRHAGAA